MAFRVVVKREYHLLARAELQIGFRDEKSWKHSDSARFMAALRSDGSAASYAAMHRSAYSRSLAAHWALFMSLLLIVFFNQTRT